MRRVKIDKGNNRYYYRFEITTLEVIAAIIFAIGLSMWIF